MEPTTQGSNRTGAATAPEGVTAMLYIAERWSPLKAPDVSLADQDRGSYIAASDALGSVPPPPTLKGMMKAGMYKMLGQRPEMLFDKIGERIAFERGGTRLYDALLLKFDVLASTTGVPELPMLEGGVRADSPRAALLRIRAQEHQHFLMLSEAMRTLGGDPTAQTPCADVVGVASMGLIQVVTDPRTTLAQSLNAVLTAELTDTAGWNLLVQLAVQSGHTDLAEQFGLALAEEAQHVNTITRWTAALATAQIATPAI
ncbi:ferritin-like domain-containing protein [Acidovorax sp. FG27]|uniref:ferritin-like domain-containing protein n=1 Tax=Acidovorax sp. FG27 TaxID=3133652 RepID=UPI0030EAB1AC